MQMDVLIFVETWTLAIDNIDIEKYQLIYRNDCQEKARNYGYAVFVRDHLYPNGYSIQNVHSVDEDPSVELRSSILGEVAINFLYAQQQCSIDHLINHLEQVLTKIVNINDNRENQIQISTIILLGHFNINLRDMNNENTNKLPQSLLDLLQPNILKIAQK